MGKVIFASVLVAPAALYRHKVDGATWVRQTKAGFENADKGIDNAIKRTEVIVDTISNPYVKDLVTKLGKKSMERLRETIKKKDGVSKMDDRLDKTRKNYEKGTREYFYPIFGSRKKNVKGLAVLGIMALSGDKKLNKCLRHNCGAISIGKPFCICAQDKLTEFKTALKKCLTAAGPVLIKYDFPEPGMKYRNMLLNKLVDSYRLPEYEPFTPDGDSHVDFVALEINGKKRLGLDVKISLGE